MKRMIIFVVAVLFVLGALSTDSLAQKKLAQTGCQFLSVGTDARATGMGEAFTTVEGAAAALFYNPAGMAGELKNVSVSFTQMTWIADIEYLAVSLAGRPFRGQYGTFGVSAMAIDYGELDGTIVSESEEQGYLDTGKFGPSAWAVGLGYAIDLTDRFSVGGQAKYVHQDLGSATIPLNNTPPYITDKKDYTQNVFAFDFGTLYKTGFKSLAFGMCVRNFSREVKFEREGFQLPLTFKVGFSMDVFDLVPAVAQNHNLLLSVDAVHPRDFPEYLNIGAEYKLMDLFALRAGYITGQDDYGFTAGFGVDTNFGVGIDYSYSPMDVFNNIHRFTCRIGM